LQTETSAYVGWAMGENKKPYDLHESQQVKEINLAVSTVLNFEFEL
jgi:hypothetical protein